MHQITKKMLVMYVPVKTCVMLFCVWTYELMLFLRSGYVQAQTDFVGVGERFCVGCFCCQSDYSDILGLRYTMTMDSYHTMCICYLRYWIILCYCWNTDWDYYCVLWNCKKCFPTWLLWKSHSTATPVGTNTSGTVAVTHPASPPHLDIKLRS